MSDLAFTSDGASGGGKNEVGEHLRGLLPHYVSGAPFDPYAVERMTPAQERFFMASQWRMMWWKLLRHRVAVVSGAVLLTMYLSILVWRVPGPLRSRHAQHRLYLCTTAACPGLLRGSTGRSFHLRL